MTTILLVLMTLGADAPAPSSTPNGEELRFFETRIRPLLAEHCWKCHGEKKQWGGLRLDSRDSILKGGDSGPAAVAGKPQESLLIRAVRHATDELKMPPEGEKLAARQIEDLEQWVARGLAFPATTPTATRVRDPNHWAFQVPSRPNLPEIANRDWPRTPIDYFILRSLEAAKIPAAPAATPRDLLRRVTFDLTGLPPTPEELAEFLADSGPDAYERAMDRLLASPAYGVRWGRHWLDVARYADSNGLDENVCHGNAWRYRDYVVESFNRDKPFDRFVVEQLAGDLLPHDSEAQWHEQLIATGFLGIGPKVLAETDEAKMRMDMIDEQLDTTGRALLGLTLGCARCHDHKFDPLETSDYYGLAGIFRSTKSMRKYTKLAEWHENLLPSAQATALQREFDATVLARKQEIERLVAEATKLAKEKAAAEGREIPADKIEEQFPDATKADLKKKRDDLAAFEKAGPQLPSAMGVAEDAVVDVAVHIRGNPLKLGDVVPRRTPPVLRGPSIPQFNGQESGRRQFAEWLVDSEHPLTARVFVNRVWRWHFGQGIVRTTDNFGALGERPSHPELLDWIARRFVSGGWSLKALHRELLGASVYRQSSRLSEDASTSVLASDPDNRLFSRASVRRLEAEAVRDALLAVGGQLDTQLGGSLLKLKNREYFFDHTSKDATTYDSRRRSLYLPVVRNNVFDLFQLLDFPDPTVSNGDRASTTVAPQALLMLNGDLVMQSAEALADRLASESTDDRRRIERLYLLTLSRAADPNETDADLRFLERVDERLRATIMSSGERRRQAWIALCHATLAGSEFIYLP